MKAIVVREVSSLVLRPPSAAITDSKSKSKAKAPTHSPTTSAVVSAQHARYYGILAFTQIVLTPREQDVAQLLITVYFELFVTVLGMTAREEKDERSVEKPAEGETGSGKSAPRKHSYRAEVEKQKKAQRKRSGNVGAAGFVEAEDANSKLLAAILNGVNRALPYAKMNETMRVHFNW